MDDGYIRFTVGDYSKHPRRGDEDVLKRPMVVALDMPLSVRRMLISILIFIGKEEESANDKRERYHNDAIWNAISQK